MSVLRAFIKAFDNKERFGYEKIYVLVDLHGTLIVPVHQNVPLRFYNHSLVAMKFMSMRDDICLILWTSSHKDKIEEVVHELDKRGIHIDYVNENPEAEDNEWFCGSKKLYFDVGIDDRFGFDAESDWVELVQYFTAKK